MVEVSPQEAGIGPANWTGAHGAIASLLAKAAPPIPARSTDQASHSGGHACPDKQLVQPGPGVKKGAAAFLPERIVTICIMHTVAFSYGHSLMVCS